MHTITKFIVVFCLTIFTQNVISQTNCVDNFTDSNFTQNPIWGGDTANFMVNGQYQLQLDAPAAGQSELFTSCQAALEASWEFWLKMDFNPSSNNFASVILMQDVPLGNASANGYFVRLGGSSADRISLFKMENGQPALLTESADDWLDNSEVNVRVKVTRNAQHQWQLLADTSGGNNFVLLGSAVDSSANVSQIFALKCEYTSTRADKFFWDDIAVNGKKYIDSVAPRIVDHFFVNNEETKLIFNEAIDSAVAVKLANYSLLTPGNSVQETTWDAGSPKEVLLEFSNALVNGETVQLEVNNVTDVFGNFMADTVIEMSFYRPDFRSVVINEIMADPEPAVGLPEVEYVELANNTLFEIELENWALAVGDDTMEIHALIPPEGFLLLLSNDFETTYDTLPRYLLSAGNGWLRNSGNSIILLDENREVIDAMEYFPEMAGFEAKENGGWSLEQINPNLPCAEPTNWSASRFALGGTPGSKNVPEKQFSTPQTALQNVKWVNVNSVVLEFSASLSDDATGAISSNLTIDEVVFSPLKPNQLRINFGEELTDKMVQILVAESVSCTGKLVADTVSFSSPKLPEMGDVIINELLFEPHKDGTDFIEIWNTSGKTILLRDLRLVQFDELGDISSDFILANDSSLLLPKTYLLLSESAAQVCAFYDCQKPRQFREIAAMPSMPSNEGRVGLATPDLQIFEQVDYLDDWHHPVVNNQRGVSLERIHPSLFANSADSWHSASSAVNYASPGRQNSQFNSRGSTKETIWLNNNSVSPNNDGSNDVLIVYYDLPLGSALTVKVYGTDGNLVHTIAENVITDESGMLTWIGKDNKGNTANSGTYIILAEWFTPNGEKGGTKLPLAVSR